MTILYELAGRAALVTGASSGIGLATVEMLARAGATVALNYLPDDPRGPIQVERLAGEGYRVIAAPGSVGVSGEAVPMVTQAIADLGRLDLLVNNAGTPGVREAVPPARLDLITEELWSELIGTNFLGVFRCAKTAAPALTAAAGAIVNVSSIAGFGPAGSSLAYGATKAAVNNLTTNLARALGPAVRVNAVAPGAVATSWQVQWSEERRRASSEHAVLKRWCNPEDIAEVILFLGFGAAMVTGQTIIVDGGLTLGTG